MGEGMAESSTSIKQVVAQRLDAPRPVDLVGNPQRGFQFTDAVLLHQLKTFGFLFGFRHCQRQVQAGRYRTEQQLH